jgi:hypothetical protein
LNVSRGFALLAAVALHFFDASTMMTFC